MATQFLVSIDLNQNELLNAVLQNLATPPSSPAAGQAYFDTNLGYARVYDGTTWQRIAPEFLSDLGAAQADLDIGSNRLTNVAEPTADTDAATKQYVDGVAQGLDIKDSVRAATTANITLSGAQTIDGVSIVSGDRVLVKDQTDASENGIYDVFTGSWVRSDDFDEDSEVTPGAFVFIEEGTQQADTGWVLSSDGTITVGTSSIDFVQFSSAGQVEGGAGLTKTGSTIDVGQGDGIVVGTDDVSVDFADAAPPEVGTGAVGTATQAAREDHTHDLPASVANTYSETLAGDGTTTEFTVTHGLGTQDVVAFVRTVDSPFEQVFVDVEVLNTTQVRFRFAVAPPVSTDYRVTITG